MVISLYRGDRCRFYKLSAYCVHNNSSGAFAGRPDMCRAAWACTLCALAARIHSWYRRPLHHQYGLCSAYRPAADVGRHSRRRRRRRVAVASPANERYRRVPPTRVQHTDTDTDPAARAPRPRVKTHTVARPPAAAPVAGTSP